MLVVTRGGALLRGLSNVRVHCRRITALVASPTIVTSRRHCIQLAGRCGSLRALITLEGSCISYLRSVTRTGSIVVGRRSTRLHSLTHSRLRRYRLHRPRVRRTVGVTLVPGSPRSSGGIRIRVHTNANNSRTYLFTKSLFTVCGQFYRDGN